MSALHAHHPPPASTSYYSLPLINGWVRDSRDGLANYLTLVQERKAGYTLRGWGETCTISLFLVLHGSSAPQCERTPTLSTSVDAETWEQWDWADCALAHHCPLAQNTLRFVCVCQRCLSYFRCGSFSRINTPKARKTLAFTFLCSAEERATVLDDSDYSIA